jgi:hypothetical protein
MLPPNTSHHLASLRRRGLRLLAAMVVALPASRLSAQVILGTVRDSATQEVIPNVTLSIADSIGAIVDETRSDDAGGFRLDGRHTPRLRFLVRKLGVQPTITVLLDIPAEADTVRVDLAAPLVGVTIATLRVIAAAEPAPNFNTQQLKTAKRSGWRVIEPYRLVEDREVASSLGDLIRRHPLPGVRPPRGPVGCYRYTRTDRCLPIVVDGQVIGPDAFVAPADVHFIAFLNSSQAAMQYGARARDGAIFIATRRRGDNERRP